MDVFVSDLSGVEGISATTISAILLPRRLDRFKTFPMNQQNPTPGSEIILYQTEDGRTRLEVKLENETVWLTQKQLAELFQKDVRTINEHNQNILAEGELKENSVIRNFRITAVDGKSYDTKHFSLVSKIHG